jgi:hypothetical protein
MSKIINYPTASLVLQTINATSSSNNKTSFTFNNINLRALLGNGMYDRYDLFNISLVQVATGVGGATIGTADDDRTLAIKMNGLQFVNQTFTSTRNTESGNACCGFIIFQRSASVNQSYYSNNALTFRKQEYVNINLFYKTLSADADPNAVADYPSATFIFQIVGVNPNEQVEPKSIINTERFMKIN